METADWVALAIGTAGALAGLTACLPATAKRAKNALVGLCVALLLTGCVIAGVNQVSKRVDPPPQSLQSGDVDDLTCSLEPRSLKPGDKATVTYTFTSKRRGRADLGADVYDEDGGSLGDGFGDRIGYLIKKGANTVSRPMRVPKGLEVGDYEVSGEIWQEGRIGLDGAETISDSICGNVAVK